MKAKIYMKEDLDTLIMRSQLLVEIKSQEYGSNDMFLNGYAHLLKRLKKNLQNMERTVEIPDVEDDL